MTSWTGGTPEHEPTTWAGRIIIFGFSFFLMMTFASFTAALAVSLIKEAAANVEANSVEGIDKVDGNICLLPSSKEPFLAGHHFFDPANVVESDKDGTAAQYADLMQKMDNGECM